MGKNKKGTAKNANLGRTLIKEKNAVRRGQGLKETSWRHTSEISDGAQDWARLNLQSVTEQSTLDEFLDTAHMAGVEFTAEKLNVKIVGTGTITGVLGEHEREKIEQLQNENRRFVTIPRRPAWDESTTPEQLSMKERDTFLDWRRSLALLQEEKELLLTPYEKNLDIWRQLWRVIERSDVVCQIVDARNPLLYKTDDLENYVREVDSEKKFIVIVNKADYLNQKQRTFWLEYFKSVNTSVIFWSALEQIESKSEDVLSEEEISSLHVDDTESENESDHKSDGRNNEPSNNNDIPNDDFENNTEASNVENADDNEDKNILIIEDEVKEITNNEVKEVINNEVKEISNELLCSARLLAYFRTFEKTQKSDSTKPLTIGLVGYPNVGKSSTINALLHEKKTAVSATPGKTKHFQTHLIDDSLCLCDCPGLVFPTFISTKAELVLNGILPIDQLKDHVAPSTMLAQLIPRTTLETTYGINIVRPSEGEDPNRPPTAEEMLNSYAKMRGFMTANGMPDCPRASRYLLKDFIKGKLLYCFPPPSVSVSEYEPTLVSEQLRAKMLLREQKNQNKAAATQSTSKVDDEFFTEKSSGFGFKGSGGTTVTQLTHEQYLLLKPWKRHGNRNKKEKLRRIHDKK